jgi:phospholipid N-methyltransferase
VSLAVHLKAYLADPRGVAALTPTSRAVVARVISKVPAAAKRIVEFGPGSGVLTRALLGRLGPEARIVAIEANAGLAARLTAQLGDPRLTVVHDTAARVREIVSETALGAADCAVSGIPFFWLSPEAARWIVGETHAALVPGGSFVTYQMFYLPRRRLQAHLEHCFREVRSDLDLRNLPPQRIYEAVK